jgi:NADPH:quinone reductase-like Zn-dependent oxidoreductase
MKALTFDPASDTFRMQDLAIPEAGPRDVLVKVLACGLNPVDAKITRWKGLVAEMDARWTPGLDVSGEIAAVGEEVRGWSVGDRVLYHGNMLRPHGGLAEYAIHKAETLLPHPALDPGVAAATPCAGWTAWRAVHDKLRLGKDHSFLVAGGFGAVGGFAIQIAREIGVRQIIATCSMKNRDAVVAFGATEGIDYRSENVATRVRELTNGRGVDRALDAVGPDEDFAVAESLAFEGEMVELVGVVRPSEYRDVFLRGLSFHQLALGAAHRAGAEGEVRLVRAGVAFCRLVGEGRVTVPEPQFLALSEAGVRLVEIRERRHTGKSVVVF